MNAGRAKALEVAGALGVTAAVFAADYQTGAELSLSLLYLGPIAYVGWRCGRAEAVGIALASVAGWLSAYFLNARFYSRPGILLWNIAMEAGIYLTVAWTVSGIRRGLDRERDLRARLEQAYQRLDLEDRRVGDIQRSLLPESLPSLDGYRFAVHYVTSARAGGDYYDFFSLPSGRLGVLVADASGHGSSAAVLMAIARALVHDEEAALDAPAELMRRLNDRLQSNLKPNQFVTAEFAALDTATGEIEVSRAGHEPPLILRAATGEVESVEQGGGPPLGPFQAARFDCAHVLLKPGDAALFYTDGLTDATSPAGDLFGLDRLREVLAGATGLEAERLRDRVVAAVERHAAGARLEDDVTLVVVEAMPAARREPAAPGAGSLAAPSRSSGSSGQATA